MKLVLGALFLILFTVGCSNKPCKIEDRKQNAMTTGQEKPATNEKDLTTHIFVAKPDGSLQCGMGKKIDLDVMKKDLNDIQVFSSQNKNDGLMRIQLCGHATGNNNVYEIYEKDLDQAAKFGFKKWIHE